MLSPAVWPRECRPMSLQRLGVVPLGASCVVQGRQHETRPGSVSTKGCLTSDRPRTPQVLAVVMAYASYVSLNLVSIHMLPVAPFSSLPKFSHISPHRQPLLMHLTRRQSECPQSPPFRDAGAPRYGGTSLHRPAVTPLPPSPAQCLPRPWLQNPQLPAIPPH